MRHQTTKALYAYWDALRAGRLAPLRNEVEPADIAALLPNAFILERTGRDAARFRMAGEAVCDLIGLALDGMSAAAIWEGASRLRIAQMIEGVVSAPAAAIIVGQSRAVGGVQGAQAEFSLLPLRTDSGAIDRILGSAAVVDGERLWRGPEPRLFGLREARLSAIRSDREESPAYGLPNPPDYPAVAEAAAPFELKAIDGTFGPEGRAPVRTIGEARGRAHLRVVRDDE